MSIGLLRVLLQSQTITNAQAEHYGNALKSGKEILPMLFADGIISPRSLGELVAKTTPKKLQKPSILETFNHGMTLIFDLMDMGI